MYSLYKILSGIIMLNKSLSTLKTNVSNKKNQVSNY